MFRRLDKDPNWLSCWGANRGISCRLRECPEGLKPTFDEPNYSCRGEIFWIYSDSEKITHRSVVNIRYSTMNGKGYWLSEPKRGRNAMEFKTRICPGTKFFGINRACDKENLHIFKRGKTDAVIADNQSKTVYDGNVIQFYENDDDYVILKLFAETNNQERVVVPTLLNEDDTEGNEIFYNT